MKIISIITEKGGVGKTTTSLHLGASFSELGNKVLIVDFDEQRNLSIGYKISKDYSYNVKNFLDKTGEFRLTQKGENLYILSGSREISADYYKRNELRERLNFLNSKFPIDIVIIDCPPSPLSGKMKLGEIALSSSDYVISPIEAEEYSIEGINELLPEDLRIKKNHNSNLNFLGFFFNKVNTRSRRFKKYSPLAEQEGKGYFLNSIVRIDESIEDAKSEGKTVFQVAPKSRASEDYKNLANEVYKKNILVMGDNGTFKIADFEEELKENKVYSNDKKDSDIVKVSLSFNVEDWLDLVRFKNHKVVELKSLDYTISDAFLYGLTLLEKKHKIERNREKVSLKRGRRNNEKPELKGTTIDIANERAGFMNDFLYFRVFDKGNLEYTRPEMMNEVVHLIKQNNKEIFKS